MEFKNLIGKTFTKVEETRDEITFIVSDKEKYRLYHVQDCCENVYIEDIEGDLKYLEGTPILRAEENSSNDSFNEELEGSRYDTFTWTFYRIATIKGTVVIRWLGTSNGYYSESVSFRKL